MASGTSPAGSASFNRRARRRALAYVLLVAVSLLLMAFSSTGPVVELQKGIGYAFRPLESALTGGASGVASVLGSIAEIDQLRRSNATLELQNQRLTTENAQVAEIKRENALLASLLQVRNALDYTTVAGTVIGRESSEFRRVVTIDVGTDRGVQIGDVVIGPGGALAGRVVGAGADFASVLLISDTSSTVIGQTEASGATGEVIGDPLSGVLVMQNIDSTERIQIGQQVVTAGIELGNGIRSPFPKGLLVGQVVDVTRDANAVVQTAYLQPAVDLDKLEYLLVITDYQGGLPPLPSPSPDANGQGAAPLPGATDAGASPMATQIPLPTPTITP